ncbi:MAG: hypothetical protein LBP53_02825 [Candidatus Peribacteria bacterium]|jgi:hypothetical protein|nr:hypothetical protein [Candidatus Peribacteria bacterium]
MNSIFTKDYQNKKIVPILKEYSAKKYGRRREFVDAETRARLGLSIDEAALPENPEGTTASDEPSSAEAPVSEASSVSEVASEPSVVPSAETVPVETPAPSAT